MCDDTLVQYAAYRVSLFPFFLSGMKGGGWYHSIPIILVGMALHPFFLEVSLLLTFHFCLAALGAGGGSGKDFFLATLLICGVVAVSLRSFRVFVWMWCVGGCG